MFWSHPNPCAQHDHRAVAPARRTSTLFRARTSIGHPRTDPYHAPAVADDAGRARHRVGRTVTGGGARADRGLVPDCGGARQPGLRAARLVHRQRRRAAHPRLGVLRSPGGRGVRARRGRPPLLHRLARRRRRAAAPRRPDGRHAVRRRGQARRGRQGSGLAQPLTTSCPTARSRTATSATTSTRRAARCCSTSGCAAPARTTRRLVVVRRGPGGTWRSSAASTCATPAATTPPTTATRRPCRWRRSTASARRGTTSSSSCAARSSAVLDAVFRERWNDPRSLDTDNPLSWLKDRLRHVDLTPGPAARRSRPIRPSRASCAVQVLRTYPAIRPQHALRPARRALGGPRLRQGVAPGAAAGVPPGPVPVVPAHRPGAGRRAARATRAAHRRRRAAAPRRRRPLRAAAQRGRPAAGDPGRAATSAPDRVHVFDLENARTAPRSTCTPRSASSTTCGRARAAPTSTGARGATTASCRARSWTTRGTTREPVDPAGLGDGARRVRPRPAADAACASTSTARRGDDADLLDPHDAVPAMEAAADALDAWHARRPGRPAAARDGCARTAPRRCRAVTRLWAMPVYRARLRPGRPLGARPAGAARWWIAAGPRPQDMRQRRDLPAFGATSREPAQPSLTVAFEVCERPAVSAASAISLGSTCPPARSSG